MHLSAADLDRYRRAVAAQQEQARSYVEASIRAYAAANPRATVAEMREYGIRVLAHAMRVYGDIACAAACMEYDAIARELGYEVDPAKVFNEVDEGSVGRDARYYARLIEGGGVDEYARRMASRVYDHVRFAANRTMGSNAERPRDQEAGMRYARVPSGRETCGFCLMLAGNGFDYTSRRAAGDTGGVYNDFHRHCDCIVISADEAATIDGYDPDWYRDVYSDARSAVEGVSTYDDWKRAGGKEGTGKDYDKWFSDRICKEIETRDREWAWTGKVPDITFETPELEAEIRRERPQEIRTAERLRPHGVRTDFVVDSREYEDEKTGLTQTVGLADFIGGYEIKTLENDCTYNTINGYLKQTSRKENARFLCFDNSDSAMDDEKLVGFIKRSRSFRRGRVYIIDSSGAYRFIR